MHVDILTVNPCACDNEKNNYLVSIIMKDCLGETEGLVFDIANNISLKIKNQSDDDISLGYGLAGKIIFLTQSYRYFKCEDFRVSVLLAVDKIFKNLELMPLDMGLFGGVTGVSLALENVDKYIKLSEYPISEFRDEIEINIFQTLNKKWERNFDLITGLVGVGVYLLETPGEKKRIHFSEILISQLTALATNEENGIYWWTKSSLLPPQLRINYPNGRLDLGLAHGVPGVIAFLAKLAALGLINRVGSDLLTESNKFILNCAEINKEGPAFKYFRESSSNSRDARDAWCYGDPGILIALSRSQKCLNNFVDHNKIINIAENLESRIKKSGTIFEHGICHGTSGLAWIFFRLSKLLNLPNFKICSNFLARKILREKEMIFGIDGYVRRGERDEKIFDSGYLEGASGIGLVLLSMIDDDIAASGWDIPLQLDTEFYRENN